MLPHVSDHPLVSQWLARLRNKETTHEDFRQALHAAGLCLAYELFRDYPTKPQVVQTVFDQVSVPVLAQPLTLIPILRAGLGFEAPLLALVPHARVEHVGLFRNPNTCEAVSYYSRLSERFEGRRVVVLDPLIATGNTLVAVLKELQQRSAMAVDVMALLMSQYAAERLGKEFPSIRIFCAAIEPQMNAQNYLIPGLGDAGDRLYGTEH